MYILEFAGTPLGTFRTKTNALQTMRHVVYDWRHWSYHPTGRRYYGSGCTAPVKHGRGPDGKAETGVYYALKHRGAPVGVLRVVRDPSWVANRNREER